MTIFPSKSSAGELSEAKQPKSTSTWKWKICRKGEESLYFREAWIYCITKLLAFSLCVHDKKPLWSASTKERATDTTEAMSPKEAEGRFKRMSKSPHRNQKSARLLQMMVEASDACLIYFWWNDNVQTILSKTQLLLYYFDHLWIVESKNNFKSVLKVKM